MIKLKSLKLENFMCVKKADLDLDHNTIVISGKSASGKSAIFDAIALCLSSKKRSSTYSEYVKQGCTHASVKLDCEINNSPVFFDLQLNLLRGTPYQMALHYNNEIFRNTEADNLLKSFDIDYYSDIIFSMQSDDYRDITQLSPTQRSNYLQRLLNFDFQKQKELVNKNLEEFKIQQIKIDNNINVKKQFIKKEEDEKEEPIKITLLEQDIKKLQNSIQIKQEKITEYQINQNKINELNTQNNQISKEVLELNIRKNEINNNLNQIKERQEQLDKSEQKLLIISKEISSLNINLEELKEKIRKNNEINSSDRMTIHSLENEKELDTKFLNEYSHYLGLEDKDQCPLCKQSVKEHIQEELKRAFYTIKTDAYGNTALNLSNFKELIKYINDKITKNETKISELKLQKELTKVIIETGEKNLIKNTTKIEQLEEEQDLIRKRLLENENLDNSLDFNKELLAINSEISLKSEQLEEIKNKINNFKIEDVSSLSTEILNETNIINKHFADQKKNEEIEDRNKKRKTNIELYNQEIKKYEVESKEIVIQKTIYEDALSILDKTLPNYMVVKTCASLQAEMNTFIQSIFPNYEVQLVNSKKGCEFFYTKDNTIIESTKKRNNAWINSKMSSGFEKALLTMAFKVSLAQLYGINILIGDEVDGAADDESSEKLFELLIGNTMFDQLFLISHKKSICNMIADISSDNIIFVAQLGNFTQTESVE